MYEKRFKAIHDLLKTFGCEKTFTFHPEYESHPIFGGTFFYRPEKEMEKDIAHKEWSEVVAAKLDVCVPTKWGQAEKGKIRFDIDWSEKASLYSMYISLPTSMRSVSLSHRTYKKQDAVIGDVVIWLRKAGCKEMVIPKKTEIRHEEQLSLF